MGQDHKVPDRREDPMIVTIAIFICFIILLLIPFIIGVRELLNPRDAAPLFIRMDYSKDPRYFGKSFRHILENAVGNEGLSPGTREVKLSKKETLEITGSRKVSAGEEGHRVYYVMGDFVSSARARFVKEIFVTGNAAFGSENMLRALACSGKVFIAEKANIIRWVDADGDVDICKEGNLGISVSSGGTLRVGKQCRFKRLYGLPVETVPNIYVVTTPEQETPVITDHGVPEEREIESISDMAWVVHKKHTVIPGATRLNQDFIARKDLQIKRDCIITGNIITYGNLVLDEDITVSGNVFAEGNVVIGTGTAIRGNVFSQGSVHIYKGARVGNEGMIKSVIGKKGVVLGQNVKIYGYVLTEGTGIIR